MASEATYVANGGLTRPENSQRTLVLNASYEPILVVGWRRAITMLWLNKVEALVNYDRQICSINTSIPLPAVVRLFRRVKAHSLSIRFSRANVYARDKCTCQYCGVPHPPNQLTYDHVVPRVMGGKTNWTNIVTCCVECNRKKGGRTPEEAGMPLLHKPVKPNWLPVVGRSVFPSETPEPWKPFLWHV